MCTNPYNRKKIAQVLLDAKKHLSVDGFTGTQFICLCILQTKFPHIDKQIAIDFIERQLGGIPVTEWVVKNVSGVTWEWARSVAGKREIQEYRLRWMNALIFEFQNN